MRLFNVHTHLPVRPDEQTIRCCGLHPWSVDASWQHRFNLFFGPLHYPGSQPPEVLQAIGECGLDRVCSSPYALQQAAFHAQVVESERRRLPVIVHCVRATDDLLREKRHATQAWVWHGFRGKPEQLHQLLGHGFYVSFGVKHNAESLAQCPAERLFLETDQEDTPIATLYEHAAHVRNTTVEALQQQLWQNANTLFADMVP